MSGYYYYYYACLNSTNCSVHITLILILLTWLVWTTLANLVHCSLLSPVAVTSFCRLKWEISLISSSQRFLGRPPTNTSNISYSYYCLYFISSLYSAVVATVPSTIIRIVFTSLKVITMWIHTDQYVDSKTLQCYRRDIFPVKQVHSASASRVYFWEGNGDVLRVRTDWQRQDTCKFILYLGLALEKNVIYLYIWFLRALFDILFLRHLLIFMCIISFIVLWYMTNAHNLQLSIYHIYTRYQTYIGWQSFKSVDGANGIEPTLIRSSTHKIPATICPWPRGPWVCLCLCACNGCVYMCVCVRGCFMNRQIFL